MKKSKSLSKQMKIMCINNKCTAWLDFVTVPSEKISYYKCPRCKGRMRKYSMNTSIKLRMKENSENEKTNYNNLKNKNNNDDNISIFVGVPAAIVFLLWKNDVPIIKFLKDYGVRIFVSLFIIGLISLLIYLIFLNVNKQSSNTNFKSFRSLDRYYMSGNLIRLIKQTILTLPFYYYIKFKSGENFLAFLNIGDVMREADISYFIFIIPFLVCYYFVKLEFLNTEFDLNNKYVDKNAGVAANAFAFGMFYGLFGWVCAAILDVILIVIQMALALFDIL